MIYDKDQQGNKIIGSDNKVVTQVGDTAINYSQEIPQWHLQRKSQIEQLEAQLTNVKSERMMAEQMVRDIQR